MYNIFTTLPLDTIIKFHVRDDLLSFLEVVEQFIVRHLPLSFEKNTSSVFLSTSELRAQLRKRVEGKPPAVVAELAIELCAAYFDFWNHLDKNQFFPIDDKLMEMTSLKRRNFLNMAEVFWKNLYNDEYLKEVKQFLALSHYYNHSHTSVDKAALNKQAWSCIVNNEDPEKGTATLALSRKINDFVAKKPLFPYAFLVADRIFSEEGNNEPKKGEELFWLRTIIDVPILTGILSSSAFSINAFIFNNSTIREKRRLNLINFLKLFNELFSSKPNEESLIFNHYKAADYTSKVAYIYDQYILERLSGINFINYLFKIKKANILPKDIIKELEKTILSPLPNFRFSFLFNHAKEICQELERIPEYINPWIAFINKIIKFQTMCSLPIADLIFHYLMALQAIDQKLYNKDYSVHYSLNMKNLISSLSTSDRYSFFAKDNDGNLAPKKYPFLLEKSNLAPIYAERCPAIYLNFFKQIIQMRSSNLLSSNSINGLNFAVTNSTISFLTNTLPSITDIVTE